MKRNLASKLGWTAALLTLLCLPAFSQGEAVRSGVDAWKTPANGLTFSDFALQPIPAGFLCEGSAPFVGKIRFRGAPVKTSPPGALGDADTVIERMDDAVFDDDGVAFTRVRFAALQMESVEPVETECGFFDVAVALTGEQPQTTMRITRLDKRGGVMHTILAGEVSLTFTPIGQADSQPKVFRQSFRFAPSQSSWEDARRIGFRQQERIALDSDGDGEVDREVLGPSDFSAGAGKQLGAFFRRQSSLTWRGIGPGIPGTDDCHCAPGEGGFVGVITCFEGESTVEGCLHLHCPEGVDFTTNQSTSSGPGTKVSSPDAGNEDGDGSGG